MGRNEETTLASVKQAALQNAKGIWPVRANAVPPLQQEHLAGVENNNAQIAAPSNYPSKTTQLFKQSNKGHLSRTGKIEQKLNTLRMMRNLTENTTPEKE